MKVEIIYEKPVRRPVKEVVLRLSVEEAIPLAAPRTQRATYGGNSVAYEAWSKFLYPKLREALKAAEVIE